MKTSKFLVILCSLVSVIGFCCSGMDVNSNKENIYKIVNCDKYWDTISSYDFKENLEKMKLQKIKFQKNISSESIEFDVLAKIANSMKLKILSFKKTDDLAFCLPLLRSPKNRGCEICKKDYLYSFYNKDKENMLKNKRVLLDCGHQAHIFCVVDLIGKKESCDHDCFENSDKCTICNKEYLSFKECPTCNKRIDSVLFTLPLDIVNRNLYSEFKNLLREVIQNGREWQSTNVKMSKSFRR